MFLTYIAKRWRDRHMDQDDKETYIYNTGADDYNLLLYVVLFVFAVIALGYVGADIYQNS